MKRFIVKLIIVLVPIAVLAIPVISIGYYIGELTGFDVLIEKQRKNTDVLIGMAYNEQTPYYKLNNANYYKPEVLVLGTSRTMQFKAGYFSKSFYNCGGAVSGNYDEYLNFLKNLDYTPKVVILGLDSWVFNDNWNKSQKNYVSYEPIELIGRSQISIIKLIIADYIKGKYDIEDIRNYPHNEGLNGKVLQNGFMYDGSYYYGDTYRYPENQKDYMFEDTFNRIEHGNDRFEYGDAVDADTIQRLDDLLYYCKEKDIQVISLVTPFAPGVYEKMQSSGNYEYINGIEDACSPIFERYGYEFHNFQSVEELLITDGYFVDGFHGGEVAYAMIIKEMIDSGSKIGRYIDTETLNVLLERRYSNLVFYKP